MLTTITDVGGLSSGPTESLRLALVRSPLGRSTQARMLCTPSHTLGMAR